MACRGSNPVKRYKGNMRNAYIFWRQPAKWHRSILFRIGEPDSRTETGHSVPAERRGVWNLAGWRKHQIISRTDGLYCRWMFCAMGDGAFPPYRTRSGTATQTRRLRILKSCRQYALWDRNREFLRYRDRRPVGPRTNFQRSP